MPQAWTGVGGTIAMWKIGRIFHNVETIGSGKLTRYMMNENMEDEK